MAAHPEQLVLVALLLLAAAIDVRSRRIPNWLTLAGTLCAVVMQVFVHASSVEGVVFALGGLAVGMLTLPLWIGGMLGAGDVKLMAMTGAFLGPGAMFMDMLFVFVTAGLAALVYAAARRSLGRLVWNVNSMLRAQLVVPVGRLPYGVSVALGTLAYLVVRGSGIA
jgi:prepilin peptidase CpaA